MASVKVPQKVKKIDGNMNRMHFIAMIPRNNFIHLKLFFMKTKSEINRKLNIYC